MNIRNFIFFILILFPYTAMCAPASQCIEKIDTKLVYLLGEKFPSLHIPSVNDLDSQSVNFDIAQGGDGCFVVTKGDFNGDKNQDYAILLTSENKKNVSLVVAIKHGKYWSVNKLPTFCESINFCYVKTDAPGTYNRSNALDFPPIGKYERRKLVSKNQVILSGTLESTGVVYVKYGENWKYVFVSD